YEKEKQNYLLDCVHLVGTGHDIHWNSPIDPERRRNSSFRRTGVPCLPYEHIGGMENPRCGRHTDSRISAGEGMGLRRILFCDVRRGGVAPGSWPWLRRALRPAPTHPADDHLLVFQTRKQKNACRQLIPADVRNSY